MSMNDFVSLFSVSSRTLFFCALLISSLSLVVGAASVAIQFRIFIDPRRFCICNSCSDRFNYDKNDVGVCETMVNAGWLVLPSNVHYCPNCSEMIRYSCFPEKVLEIKVPRDFDVSRLNGRNSTPSPINPYEATMKS